MIPRPGSELLRAPLFHTPRNPFQDSTGLECFPDGGLLIREGRVATCGHYSDLRVAHPEVATVDMRGGFLLPGFIDTHIHFPQLRVIGSPLVTLIECRAQSNERGQSPVHPLEVDGDEELLGHRELGEVGREPHRTDAFAASSPVDGSQREPEAGDRGVDACRGAQIDVVRGRGHRSGRVRRTGGRLWARQRQCGPDESQGEDGHRVPTGPSTAALHGRPKPRSPTRACTPFLTLEAHY